MSENNIETKKENIGRYRDIRIEIKKNNITKIEVKKRNRERFFKRLIYKRKFDEIPELVSKTCSNCSCCYFVSTLKAIENALEIEPSNQTNILRKILCNGERIRNNIFFLYAKYLLDNTESFNDQILKNKRLYYKVMRIINTANDICYAIGGNKIHPFIPQIGGFVKLPEEIKLKELLKDLKSIKDMAFALMTGFIRIKQPRLERDYEFISLKQIDNYAFSTGTLSSSMETEETLDYNSLFNIISKNNKDNILTGPIARISNNSKLLSYNAEKLMKKFSAVSSIKNPFNNIACICIETVHLIDRSIELLENLKIDREEALPEIKIKKSKGISVIESSFGLIGVKIKLDDEGLVDALDIVNPNIINLNTLKKDCEIYLKECLKSPKTDIDSEFHRIIRAHNFCDNCGYDYKIE